jgi:hypothetical protein
VPDFTELDQTLPSRRSRRALLAGVLGGMGAWAAAAAARVGSVRGANGDHMEVGGQYTAESGTAITGSGDFIAFLGANTGSGRGLSGRSVDGIGVDAGSTHGTAVFATTSNGYAIHAMGGLRLDRASGVATIAPGTRGVTVRTDDVDVTRASFLLLTPKANLGGRDLWYTTRPRENSFRIRMSGSPRATPTRIAWLLLDSDQAIP